MTGVDLLGLEIRHGPGVFRPRDIVLASGRGTTVVDTEGREYLDFTSGYGTAPLGHAHPALVAAIREQSGRILAAPSIFGSDVRARLLADYAELWRGRFQRFFLCNSGTEAVEAALKIARLSTGRTGFVAAERGFHGRTMGALSVTWQPGYRTPFEPLVPGVRHVPYGRPRELEEAVDESVAAVILEVVQGEGGVHPASPEYVRCARDVCRRSGALLILDEVQTGFGRTGAWLAADHFGVDADLVCLAKGLGGGVPVAAVAMGAAVATLSPGQHGSTFGGNPLACAAARATLATIRDEGLCERAAELGARLASGLEDLACPRVREVRGLGLMVGVELRVRAMPYLKRLQARGVLALPAGPDVLRFLPPLTVTEGEIDGVTEIVAQVLNEAHTRETSA